MDGFTVARREVHISYVDIEADNADEAKRRVVNGEGDVSDYFEYSHTLDPETWTVEEKEEEGVRQSPATKCLRRL